METIRDIAGRALFMCFFIIPVPIGAYTIHNGSSATVAMTTYLVLSLLIPLLYLSSSRSGFGADEARIGRMCYVASWIIAQGITYVLFHNVDFTWLWELPTIARDVVFICVMSVQVVSMMSAAYAVGKPGGR